MLPFSGTLGISSAPLLAQQMPWSREAVAPPAVAQVRVTLSPGLAFVRSTVKLRIAGVPGGGVAEGGRGVGRWVETGREVGDGVAVLAAGVSVGGGADG
jgi:hypothetical protein